MANIAKVILCDRDIRNLCPASKRYKKAVGNPKELYIFVYPSGLKTFSLKLGDKYTKLKEFREGIYSVAEARKEATRILHDIENGIEPFKSSKYTFKNLFSLYIAQKHKKGLSEAYLAKVASICEKYLMPSLAEMDAKDIKYSDLLAIFNAIYNPSNPSTSRLETIRRLIWHTQGALKIALKDRHITYNPAADMQDEFMTQRRFSKIRGIDTRYPALVSEDDLGEFLRDLKNDNKMELQTKRAIYLQILGVNRPINTASARWRHIDLESGVWRIPANEMKMQATHEIPLTKMMQKILKEQFLFSGKISEFVFPAKTAQGHIHRDSIGKAIKNLGARRKWHDRASSHGFRASFRTICTLHKTELLKLDISDEVIESLLAHKESDDVRFAYERSKATLEQKRKALQWYEDYLNSLEPFCY